MRKNAIVIIASVTTLLMLSGCSIGNRPVKNHTTTIAEMTGADVERLPSAINYEYIGDVDESGTARITDEDIIRRITSTIMNTKVSTMGEEIDMYVFKDVTFEFEYEDETVKYSFTPYSYFNYKGLSYELNDSEISGLSSYFRVEPNKDIDEREGDTGSEETDWRERYPEITTEFIDNGDEAMSATLITLNDGNKEYQGYLLGAYDILEVEKDDENDGIYKIIFTYGDFYNHDQEVQCRMTIEGDELLFELI